MFLPMSSVPARSRIRSRSSALPGALAFYRMALCLSLISIAALTLMGPAQAGTWSFAATKFTWSHTINGANFGMTPRGYESEVYAGGGQDGVQNTMFADEHLTVTATWVPDPNSASDPAPASVIAQVKTTAEANEVVNSVLVPGTNAEDGYGDPINSYGVASGTHYKVESGNSFTITLDMHAGITNQSGYAYASVGGVSISILNGNWDGPYYFHNGIYFESDGGSNVPWANNTAGSTPAISDISDSNNLFSLSDTTTDECLVEGSITPVWFWNGPDLGVAPPSFETTVTTTAFCRDYNEKTYAEFASDGLAETEVSAPPDSQEYSDSETVPVKVQSDEYAPGEGNGYWAIGPTIQMNGQANDSIGDAPYNLYSSVELTAVLEGGYNV